MVYFVTALAIAVLICGYYYFQTVSLSRQLLLHKKELNQLNKIHAELFNRSEQMIQIQERIYQRKLRQLKQTGYEQDYELKALEPLINHFAFIAKEYLKGKGELIELVKNFYEQNEPGSHRKIINTINERDTDIRQAWQQNNIAGLIYVIDTIIISKPVKVEQEKTA
jgi:hypothetical protein